MDERVLAALRGQLGVRQSVLRAGARHVGWKVALQIAPVQGIEGRDAPVFGYLTTATVLEPGAAFVTTDAMELYAETELAVELGHDLRIERLAAALELVDTAQPPADLDGVLAANVYHRAVAFGEFRAGEAPAETEERVAAIGELLESVGERFRPGDRIICGSITHDRVHPGDTAVAELDGLGRVELRIGA